MYFVLNKIHPGLYARSPDVLTYSPRHTTSDLDVLERRWLLVDVDPDRPSGISSTDAEMRESIEVRDRVAKWIESTSDCQMVQALSGNGAHLLMRTSNETTKEAIESFLDFLSDMFVGFSRVKIDSSVGKLAQLTKLYGTKSRKGYATTDRPHRFSKIERVRYDRLDVESLFA